MNLMIQPKDNSDNSWLVIADWMDDNNIIGANELRESIIKPIISNWEYEYRFSGAVGGGGDSGSAVGGVVGSYVGVGVGGVGGGGGGVGGVGVGGGGSDVGGGVDGVVN